MNLYRAVFQSTPQTGGTLRRMTFAAEDARRAGEIAEDWQLPGDRLLIVREVRPLQQQMTLL